jgi:CubicO group peptidase (beta-lactamase class C family)
MNGHEDTALLLHAAMAARRAAPERPVARASAEDAAAARRALQRKHGVALEQGVRGDVAVAVRLLAMACEEHTGQHMPALVREVLADVLMCDGRFALWPPATRPRV